MGDIRAIAWACVVANGRIGGLRCVFIYRVPILTVSCDVNEENFPTFKMYSGIDDLS